MTAIPSTDAYERSDDTGQTWHLVLFQQMCDHIAAAYGNTDRLDDIWNGRTIRVRQTLYRQVSEQPAEGQAAQ